MFQNHFHLLSYKETSFADGATFCFFGSYSTTPREIQLSFFQECYTCIINKLSCENIIEIIHNYLRSIGGDEEQVLDSSKPSA